MFPSDDWYQREFNTAKLVKAVAAELELSLLSGNDIWNLLRLTWITRSQDHWRRLKIPALASLFHVGADLRNDLESTILAMNIPKSVKGPATKATGFSNAYNAYRNSSQAWCSTNRVLLRRIISSASTLGLDDRSRIELAAKISKLSGIPDPQESRKLTAHNLITPLIACMDELSKFPIINGRREVREMLTAFGADTGGLKGHVTGLMDVIGQFGITDAFYLDTMGMADIAKITGRLKVLRPEDGSPPTNDSGTHPLEEYDEAERKSILSSRTITYRRRHNRITSALKRSFASLEITQGNEQDCRYDALIHNYDGKGRDLLIEAKPDLDKGSFRLAIGQLLDYRSHLKDSTTTDLALLSISPPNQRQSDLLKAIGIHTIWFSDESCAVMSGNKDIWSYLGCKYVAHVAP